MAYELAASFEKLTDARLWMFSSDIFSNRSAAAPCRGGNASTWTDMIHLKSLSLLHFMVVLYIRIFITFAKNRES